MAPWHNTDLADNLNQSHQTAMPQPLYSVLKTCQCTVGSPRNTQASNLPPTVCTQRPHSVPTAFTRRSHSIAPMTLRRRPRSFCSVFMARSRCEYSVITTIIDFLNTFSYFEQTYFANIVIYFDFKKQFVKVFALC